MGAGAAGASFTDALGSDFVKAESRGLPARQASRPPLHRPAGVHSCRSNQVWAPERPVSPPRHRAVRTRDEKRSFCSCVNTPPADSTGQPKPQWLLIASLSDVPIVT